MEWFTEILKDSGLSEDAVSALVDKVKAEFPKHAVPKEQYNKKVEALGELEKEHETAKGQLEAFNGEISQLREKADLSDEMKEKFESINGEYDTYKNGEAERLAGVRKEMLALNLAGKYTAEDTADVVAGMLDLEKLVLSEDGKNLLGFDDQINSLKSQRPSLFIQEQVQDSNGEPQSGDNVENAGLDVLMQKMLS